MMGETPEVIMRVHTILDEIETFIREEYKFDFKDALFYEKSILKISPGDDEDLYRCILFSKRNIVARESLVSQREIDFLKNPFPSTPESIPKNVEEEAREILAQALIYRCKSIFGSKVSDIFSVDSPKLDVHTRINHNSATLDFRVKFSFGWNFDMALSKSDKDFFNGWYNESIPKDVENKKRFISIIKESSEIPPPKKQNLFDQSHYAAGNLSWKDELSLLERRIV